MAKKLVDGVWVIACDWQDPETGEGCSLGLDGEPAMYVDPTAGQGETHFQCGRHHGVIPQKEKEEFQLPEGHKLNQEVISSKQVGTNVEEFDDDGDD